MGVPGANTLSRRGEESNLLALHPTVKPVAMIVDALLDCTAPADLVLDTFLDSRFYPDHERRQCSII